MTLSLPRVGAVVVGDTVYLVRDNGTAEEWGPVDNLPGVGGE